MQHFVVHPENPQRRLIKKAVELLQKDVIAYPTDSYYAFGCLQRNKKPLTKSAVCEIDAHTYSPCHVCLRQVVDYAVINTRFTPAQTHAPGPTL